MLCHVMFRYATLNHVFRQWSIISCCGMLPCCVMLCVPFLIECCYGMLSCYMIPDMFCYALLWRMMHYAHTGIGDSWPNPEESPWPVGT